METYDANKSTTEVRQGSHTHKNLWVLLISSAIVIAAFAIIYVVFLSQTPPTVL